MKRKILAAFLAVSMTISMASCGASSKKTEKSNSGTTGAKLEGSEKTASESSQGETTEISFNKKELEDGTLSIWYFETENPEETIVIPGEIDGKVVSQIGERLFEGNEEVKKVVLPESIRTIGNSAFNFAAALETVEISGPVETLENSSFYGCDALQELNFPEGLKKIGDNAIAACSSLTDLYLPGSVEEIDENNFALCGNPLKIHVSAGSATETRIQEIMENNNNLNIEIVEE